MAVTASIIDTPRLATFVRQAGEPGRPVVVLVHGNVSSSLFFEDLMEELADDFHVIAPDFRGFGGSERKAIDATRGMRDFSDDLDALVETMGLATPLHLLGWSAGGGVVMQYALDRPEHVASIVLESGMSPFGFGGTKDVDGTPVTDDYAGSGGGTANPNFVESLRRKDASEDPAGARATMRSFYVADGFTFDPETEDRYVEAMLEMAVGDDVYPGDMTPSDNWPGVAPGTTGMNNAISPKYLDLSAFGDLSPAPPVLWIRGDSDQIVSDTSVFDFAYLGQLGAVPGWPGPDACPPQPMVSQLRAVLERGGNYRESVYETCGHSPHLEKPERFTADVRSWFSSS